MTAKKAKLIIVDDHKMFLDGLSSILTDAGGYEIILKSNSGAQVKKYLDINTEEPIDLVVTDVNMPETDGIALNAHIKEHHPRLRTLVVSMRHDAKTIHRLTQDGVDGYVPKNAEKAELLEAIATIVGGKKYFSESIKQTYMQHMFDAKKEEENELTTREKEVLVLIAQEFTTQEIADKLFLSKHTIESYRKNLISKLQVRNLAGLTAYAIKSGLVE
ncbi:response regulator [Maribacter sp. 2307ULW6-5]|uniref:response regulator n=1 Tax=Maribacter sp. 2307ULW6-5 TaxID=3386275 RepID=UPI0039BC7D9E